MKRSWMKGTNKHMERNWYVSTFTEIFLNQKRMNVCEHTVKLEFTNIFSLLIQKDLCECRNESIKFPCVYLCLSSREHYFSIRASPFYSYFCVIRTLVLSLSTWRLGKLSFQHNPSEDTIYDFPYKISREKFEPEPGIFLLRSYNVKFPKAQIMRFGFN